MILYLNIGKPKFRNKSTKYFSFAVLLLLSTAFAPAFAESVKSLDSILYLDSDGSITASDAIVIDFGQTLKKDPVSRTLCLKPHSLHKRKEDAVVHVAAVTNESGCTLKHTTKHKDRQAVIVVEDPRKFVSGVNLYKFDYTLQNAVTVFNGKPELDWNATGIWKVPVEKATIKLYLPKDATARHVEAFIDSASLPRVDHSKKRCQTASQGNELKFVVTSLLPGESLHIAVGLPAVAVAPPPTKVVEAEHFWQHWKALFAVPIGVCTMLLFYWLIFGRDQTIKPEDVRPDDWRPPTDLTPAEAGTLIDEHCDKPDVVATLIDLAARGYLRIEEKSYGGIQMQGDRDYRFTRLSPPVIETLKPHEDLFIRNLFGFVNDQDMLSNMRGHFHEHIHNLNRDVWESLHKGGYFMRHPEEDRRLFLWMSCFLFILGGGALIATSGEARLAGAGSVAASLIVALSASAMPARTSKGSAALKQLKSFKEFIHKADRSAYATLYHEDPTIFSRYLPYAIVLKEGGRWADHFEGIVKELPDWFHTDHSGAFSPHWMASDLKHALRIIETVFLDQPVAGTAAIDIVDHHRFK